MSLTSYRAAPPRVTMYELRATAGKRLFCRFGKAKPPGGLLHPAYFCVFLRVCDGDTKKGLPDMGKPFDL